MVSDVSSQVSTLFRSKSGFLLDKKIGVNQPKRMENVSILIANTGMDTDKIKVSIQWSVSLPEAG